MSDTAVFVIMTLTTVRKAFIGSGRVIPYTTESCKNCILIIAFLQLFCIMEICEESACL